ncbi:MAG TPA: histidine kinase, partial [Puia sp.]|nr:histidine kinase [Puia sp.]
MLELNYVKFGHDLARQRVLLHLSFWIAVIVFFNFVFRNDRHPLRTLYDTLEFLPGHLLFVYSLIYVLIPHFILKGKIVASVGVLLAIVAASLFCLRLSDVYLTHYSGSGSLWMPRGFPRSIFALFSVGWIAASIKLVKYWYQEKEIQQRLEKEKLTVELQLLKSQLHPHFLFNTLNNLYSLTLESSSFAPQVVLKLSSLLRYILYECN